MSAATASASDDRQVRKAQSQETAWWRKVLPIAGVVLIVLYCLAPFYWMVITALKPQSEQFSTKFWPENPTFGNLKAVFTQQPFGRALLNSLIVAGSVTVLTLIIGMVAAYALARLEFKGKNIVLFIIVMTSMFPGIAIIVPLLKIFTDINWIDTYQALILPSLSFALPLAVWNLTAFFRQMPQELEQAAMVDGCTPSQAFRKVIIPLAAPGVFTTAIITFIAAWNEFMIALAMTQKTEMKTANVMLSQFTGISGRDSPFATQMAAGVIVTIPLVIAVLIFQRRIVAGLTAGGVK